MGQGASETDVSVDLSPEPMSAATGEPKRPEPLVDEDVLTLALRQLVDDYLAAHPWMVWRRAVGYIVNVEGQWRKLSKRKYLSSVAAHCRRNGYSGRGIMHELVLARVREGLERREIGGGTRQRAPYTGSPRSR